jgi:UDP-N-acetyl-2-amino-2-deoxyglucuronate dehydrogenase
MAEGGKTKFAIIGFGRIGRRHMEVLGAGNGFELVAVCDSDPSVSASVQQGIPFFNSVDELLVNGPDFEVASVATPNGLHEEHATTLLKGGKHVVIEKPMALTKKGCQRIIAEAEENDREVFCLLQLKFSPVARWLKQLVEDGTLGKLYLVQMNCFWNRGERYYASGGWHGTKSMDGGTLFTQFSHYIDLLYWLFGDFKNISSRLRVYRNGHLVAFEDTGLVSFEFAGGGMGNLNFSTAVCDKNFETNLSIICEKGTVKVSGQYLDDVQYCNVRDAVVTGVPDATASPLSGHRLFFENVAQVLAQNTNGLANAHESMKVVEIIERIYDSAVICGPDKH